MLLTSKDGLLTLDHALTYCLDCREEAEAMKDQEGWDFWQGGCELIMRQHVRVATKLVRDLRRMGEKVT